MDYYDLNNFTYKGLSMSELGDFEMAYRELCEYQYIISVHEELDKEEAWNIACEVADRMADLELGDEEGWIIEDVFRENGLIWRN